MIEEPQVPKKCTLIDADTACIQLYSRLCDIDVSLMQLIFDRLLIAIGMSLPKSSLYIATVVPIPAHGTPIPMDACVGPWGVSAGHVEMF